MHLSLKDRIARANQTCPDVWAGFLDGLTPLDTPSQRPLGVMVSGGGDSLALLHFLWAWGQRPLEVFCVDHGLNPQSAVWTQKVADICGELGVGFTALKWAGEKPAQGIQAAARQARHSLINEAARTKNIQILCLGHNADDGREAALMRDMGSSVGSPKPWGPSPLWPEGRGLFYLRPLIGICRARLRQWLDHAGIGYVDDPANDNPTYLRARARKALQSDTAHADDMPVPASNRAEKYVLPDYDPLSSSLRFDRQALLEMDTELSRRWLACALVSAGGGNRLPRNDSLSAVHEAIRRGDAVDSCLSGARVWLHEWRVTVGRNSGEFARTPMPPVALRAGETIVWDGRFEITADKMDGEILPLKGLMSQLSAQDVQSLKALPPALRPSVPVWRSGEGGLHLCPYGGQVSGLVFRRFCAHAGLWRSEGDLE
ncbi:MAG: tRNA lysidine(34) synthetase TilS [Asticcacaulis sp.]